MEHHGPDADVEIPAGSLHDVIFATLTDEERALVAYDHAETGQVLTYAELADRVDRVATWLAGHGVAKGDVTAIALPNCPDYATVFHGTLRIGAVVTPVNSAAAAGEVGRQFAMTQPKVVFTCPLLLGSVQAALMVAALEATIVLLPDPTVTPDDVPHPDTVPFDELLATGPNPPQVVIDPVVDLACLPVSSGTSGLPKAVMLTHRNLVANMSQFGPVVQMLEDRHRMVAFLPYSHIFALTTILNFGLVTRSTQLTMSSFQAHLLLDVVATRQPTFLFLVPPVAAFLSRSPAALKVDWTPLRLVISGAAPLDDAIGEALQERLGARVIQGYGMTEMSPVTHAVPVLDRAVPISSIGRAMPNLLVRVVDPDTGQDVPEPGPGQWSAPGELWVKGPNTMVGYLDNPEATAEVIDADGYLHTGDLVVFDDTGVTRIVDRIKELIKRRGFQIPPAELETHLLEHPDVLDAAVIGLDAPGGDQVPHALLVLREGIEDPQAAVAQVLHWLNGHVAPYKNVPSGTVVGSLPRTAAGKVVRRQLRDLVG